MRPMKLTRLHFLAVVLVLAACAIPFRNQIVRFIRNPAQSLGPKKTVDDRLKEFGSSARQKMSADFSRIGIPYPPRRIVLVGLKDEDRLEVWVSDGTAKPKHLKTYPILAASGGLGPKLREGDHQVPEGFYAIESLNPNSAYHLALRVNYPNAFDLEKARIEGRSRPGSDIMIHGSSVSVGCLAMGDPAIEELFVLAADTSIENIRLILAPVDFRTRDLPASSTSLPVWAGELYAKLRAELLTLGSPASGDATKTGR